MKLVGFLGAGLAAVVAIGAGLLAIIAVSPVALMICLLALILFFVAASATRRLSATRPILDPPVANSANARPSSVSDREKLRRLAAKLGVDPEPEPVRPLAENEAAAREAMADILRGVRKGN